VKANIGKIMDEVWNTINFGIGRKNDDERVDHALFDDPAWKVDACKPLREMARQQLGTVRSGSHYMDIFEDEFSRVWIGVHCGSRGLGHKTATWFLKAAGASDGMDVEPCILPVASDLGAQYLEGMRLGWVVCVCRTRLGVLASLADPWGECDGGGSQSSQLRVA
jgi:tRNA-splicing ligase RtcB